jgi:hypothetical protein
VVILDTPWWTCARRAIIRGIRHRPEGFELPAGCRETSWRRLRDEWRLVWRIWKVRQTERDLELNIMFEHEQQPDRYILRSAREAGDFIRELTVN